MQWFLQSQRKAAKCQTVQCQVRMQNPTSIYHFYTSFCQDYLCFLWCYSTNKNKLTLGPKALVTETESLTLFCLVYLSILINSMSPLPILEMSGILFHFYLIFDRNLCKQTVETLIRCRILQHLICTSGLHCLPRSQKWDARLKRVNEKIVLPSQNRPK